MSFDISCRLPYTLQNKEAVIYMYSESSYFKQLQVTLQVPYFVEGTHREYFLVI